MDPIRAMEDRVNTESQVSDASYCDSVLNEAEMLLRHVTALLVAALPSDSHRDTRYRHEYTLMRSAGIGDWSLALQSLVVGNLHSVIRDEVGSAGLPLEQLIQKVDTSDWRHAVVDSLRKCLDQIGAPATASKKGTRLLNFFIEFPQLRNKMDAHGAPTSAMKAAVASELAPALELLRADLSILQLPLVHVQADRTVGRPVVRSINSEAGEEVRVLAERALASVPFSPGVYAVFGERVSRVSLVESQDLRDYFYANGGHRSKDRTAEYLSYVTGRTVRIDIADWESLPTQEAGSETAGSRHLVERGGCYTNAPQLAPGYIERDGVQRELLEALEDDRRFIVTLKGRGGVGKTSLALRAIDDVCSGNLFDLIVWFSARDIDLRQSSSVRVRPEVVSVSDIELSARSLLAEIGFSVHEGESVMRSALGSDELGSVLWVFDNFETLHDPAEVFSMIDTHVRRPHKVLITTRHRDSKGDFAIEVPGMTEPEFNALVDEEVIRLGLSDGAVDRQYLYKISDGHPYVTKVILSEIRERPRAKIEIALRDRDDLLESLFERTLDRLSDAARHVFMLLCSWRSDVPEVGLDVAINGTVDPPIDIEAATDQLELNSLIDVHTVAGDVWIHVPFPAWVFGNRKLQTDPSRVDILLQSEILQMFGATDARRRDLGLSAPAMRFWRAATQHVAGPDWVEWQPRVERLAREVPALWMALGERYLELGETNEGERCYRRVLDVQDSADAWLALARLYEKIDDDDAALNAWVQRALDPTATIDDVSHAANKVNGWLHNSRVDLPPDKRRLLVEPLIDVMWSRRGELAAVDYSRLAWLCSNVGDDAAGVQAAELGIEIDSAEEHCIKYLRRIRG